jgi:large subunit ribosomal protein L5
LTEIVLPRIREYKGISNNSGDKGGNVQFGLTPNDVRFFPEIEANQDLWPKVFGMHINVVTSAQTDFEARTLLSSYGFAFTGTERNIKPEHAEY